MKLQKFAKQVIRAGAVTLWIVRETGAMFLSSPYAVFPVEKFPQIEDEEQLATVLDIPKDKWESIRDRAKVRYIDDPILGGMNLLDNILNEQMATRQPFGIEEGIIVTEGKNRRVTFIDMMLLDPIQDEMKDSEAQITYWRREMDNGTPYVVVKDGMFLIGAIMPKVFLNEEYLRKLAEYQSLCISEFERQKQGKTEEIIEG